MVQGVENVVKVIVSVAVKIVTVVANVILGVAVILPADIIVSYVHQAIASLLFNVTPLVTPLGVDQG